MIFFTSDIDWAPDAVIDDMLQLFTDYGQSCTLFATHDSTVLQNIKKDDLFEIGIHPNFNKLLNCTNVNHAEINAEIIIDQLLEVYPESQGIRSHSTTSNSYLLDLFFNKGLKYDSNIFLPYQSIKPFSLWNGFTRIPYNWEDDVHYLYGHSFSETLLSLDEKLFVLDFHPIHIYLNTDTEERYHNAKAYYKDASKLLGLRNTETKGARTLLISLLENLRNQSKHTKKMSDILHLQPEKI